MRRGITINKNEQTAFSPEEVVSELSSLLSETLRGPARIKQEVLKAIKDLRRKWFS